MNMVTLKIIDDEFQENERLNTYQRKDLTTKEVRIDSIVDLHKEITNDNEDSNSVTLNKNAEQFKDNVKGCK